MGHTTAAPGPTQLADAIRKAGVPEADAASRRRAEYSSDALNYRVVPEVVVFPRHADEIMAVLAVCRELGVPVAPRGGGTSIAGNAISTGVVLDTSRHLNRVLEVDPEARTAAAEPGAVLDDITAAGAPHGLRFGPDPSTHARATIGGSIGNNACGARALRYGRTADNVVALDVVTGAGTRFTARRYGRDGGRETSATGPEAGLLSDLGTIVGERLAMVRTEFGRFPRQVSGYSLEHLLPENGTDLAKFLVGTEGTLALTLRATVRLVAAPRATAMAVLGYADMAAAAAAVPGILPYEPVALEGLDSRLVDVVRARRGPAAVPDLPRGGGWLFIETAGTTLAEAEDAAAKLSAAADCLDSAVVSGPKAAALWRIREDGAGLGGRTPAGAPAWPGWEDSAVPPDRLPDYLRELQALLTRHGLDGLMYGHFGDGCVHVRIDFPLRSRPRVLREFTEDAAKLAAAHGGSASGEHGDGRARGELLRYMYSPAALDTFALVKRAFDPDDVLNPGVIVSPAALDADLRVPAARPVRERLGLAYARDGGDFATAVHRCAGVGKCRADTTRAGGVMCPSFLATRDEKDSTRARARVLQELANGSLVTGWRAAEISESLDLCLSCKGCSADCPAGVDMAAYKAEALYQRYRGRPGRPRITRWAGCPGGRGWPRVPRGSPTPCWDPARWPRAPSGWAGSTSGGRCPRSRRKASGGGSTAGVRRRPAAGRCCCGPTRSPTRSRLPSARRRSGCSRPPAYSVRIPQRSVCCGLTWISTGQLDGARRQLRRTLRTLAPALDAGIPVVGLEPSCTAVLRDDVFELLPGDEDAAKLRGAVHTLAELLRKTDGWSPPDLSGVTGVAQPHCHHHAVLGWEADAALLADAGAQVKAVGGCCGLAGNFGVERGHYDVSVAVAETALLPAVRAAGPGAAVLADGFSCRTQLGQLAGVRGRHLAEVLAAALDQPQ